MDDITYKINKQIAEYFTSDSREFLFRYQQLKEFQTHISSRGKLLIDLMFSIECSLKALIFFESQENEKITFKKIKTHNLKHLFNQVIDRSEVLQVEETIDAIDLYNVSARYTLDANIQFKENNILSEKYYATIANFQWLDDIYHIAKALLDYVSSKIHVEIPTVNLADIDIEKEIEIGNRIKNLHLPS